MPERALQSLGVLVTRPVHQAEELCSLIEQAGGRPCRLPLLEIADPTDVAGARQTLARWAGFDLVIFISANAVQRCYSYIGGSLPASPLIACVGQGTARQLQAAFGRAADLLPSEGFNSEALLALPQLQTVQGKQILLIKGEGGRDLLAGTLTDRGAVVSYANLYRRKIPADLTKSLAAIGQQNRIDVVVLTSGEAIDNLLGALDESTRAWLCDATWLVIHPRLAAKARRDDCRPDIIVSDGPGDDEIVRCLARWATDRANI